MELNAKIASLEDEVKLLKGEVKLILSEIRTAILGQDNPFAEPGQGLRLDPSALDSRPPIKVVRVSNEAPEAEEEAEAATALPEDVWENEPEEPTPMPEPVAMEKPPEARQVEEPPPVAKPAMSYPTPPPLVPPPKPIAVRPIEAAVAPKPQAVPPQPVGRPHWSLITIAGLAVWAEEAIKQIGVKRLRILLDLCEFTGDLSPDAKEALLKVSTLAHATLERKTPPSTNECLVVLCQLDALLRGEQPASLSLHGPAEKWQQTA